MEMEFESEIIGQDILEKLIPTLGNGNVTRNLSIWAEREYGGKTLLEIGHQFCLSTERIRQIHQGKFGQKVVKVLEEAA